MRNVFLIIILLCLSGGEISAQDGDNSFLFMLIGPGSRASAMGEAYTAVGGDAGAPYFNPAAATWFPSTEFSFMHVSYLTDASLEHFAVLTGSRSLRFGLGLYLGKTADFERRDNTPTDDPLGRFDEHNFTASSFWAIPVSDKLGIGSSFKWAYQKLDIEDASAFAVDLGAIYAHSPVLSLGASVRNLGTRPKFIAESFDLPREFRLGAAYDFRESRKLKGLLLSTDYILANWGENNSRLNIGSEYTYQNLISLRLGYSLGYESRGLSAGGGISYINYRFDYAYVPSRNNLNDTHRFTLRLKI